MHASFCPELTGSMSQGAAGNPTVAMVEAAYRHHGLNWRYINMEVAPEQLAAAVTGAFAQGYRGFNLSMPHKVTVIPLLAGLAESASIIGAVNCVVRRDGRFVGENTDGKGFLTSLQAVMDVQGARVVLFGAGGAARAVAVELALAGAAHLTLVNRDEARGAELASVIETQTACRVSFVPWRETFRLPSDAQAVINGTSIGLYEPEARLNLEADTLRPGMVVADVVFNPVQTALLRDAAAHGCRVVDGLGMLVNQGVIGVRHWTGLDPDPAVMRTALEQAMNV